MTFALLAKRVRVNVSAPVGKIKLLREAENDFIEKTLCTETFTEINTSDENDGTLTNLYDLPSDFVKEHRVEWDGSKIDPLPQGTDIQIYNSNNELYTGTPQWYWIENEDIQLIKSPSAHSIIGLWYANYNTDDSSASPIIPTIEHTKLLNYVNATLLELDGQESRAAYYWAKYNADVAATERKYWKQRNKQGAILDVTSYSSGRLKLPGGEASVTVVETNIVDSFMWKRVQLSNTDSYPPTEETFTTGSGQLTSGALDSPQNALPKFSSLNSFVVEVVAKHQDRDCFVSTRATVSGTNVTFGLTLSEAGRLDVDCYFDITLKQLS